ncbi:MAG TPA: polyribonucleotide nucleotidyltransferase, partial [Anaerolineales bacterium]|nr:polyribonucleotide nucleotidyltransferase [Anaerolineales bacterium]
TGKLAGQAGGAVTVRQEDSVLLATATMSKNPREGLGFFPLTVDYEERLYAGGRIPGSFFRREGRPTEGAILTARLTDRTIRPLFPKDMRNEVQVILYALSSDGETPLDVLGLVGASAALTIADVPFAGPVGTVRVAIQDGNFVINPSYKVMDESVLDLVIAGTSEAIMMVECGAKEVEEAEIVKAFETGQDAIKLLIDLQTQMQSKVGKPKRSYPSFQLSEEIQTKVSERLEGRVQEFVKKPLKKAEQTEALNALRDEAIAAFAEEEEWDVADVREAFENVHKAAMRSLIIETKIRTDGRGPKDIREIHAEVEFSPRAHGSGLFTRGETQVLTLATVGTPRERQELDGLSPRNEKRYMHHYNFPPFSVGETKFLRGASRREIGHGALAERALLPVIPPQEEFPYTMRLVSEVLSSNGSSSMASVCGSTLALMDTGVPIREPVAGVAMGLIKEGDQAVILTDILGLEDHLGDMDFKVAGTHKGITALQMDIKITGITSKLMSEALAQAREARLFILEKIKAAISAPREELKPHVPRMTIVKVDPEKIGAIIGPGGKMIRKIQEETGTRIDIEDDGTVFISAADGDSAKAAKAMVDGLIEEAVLGRIYTGKVVRTTDFGAFVEILPGTDGLVHISQLDSEHTESVEDVARLGEEITVMVTNVGHDGKIRLSRKAVLAGWTLEEAMENDRPPSGRRPSKGGDRRRSGGSSKYRGNKDG